MGWFLEGNQQDNRKLWEVLHAQSGILQRSANYVCFCSFGSVSKYRDRHSKSDRGKSNLFASNCRNLLEQGFKQREAAEPVRYLRLQPTNNSSHAPQQTSLGRGSKNLSRPLMLVKSLWAINAEGSSLGHGSKSRTSEHPNPH